MKPPRNEGNERLAAQKQFFDFILNITKIIFRHPEVPLMPVRPSGTVPSG